MHTTLTLVYCHLLTSSCCVSYPSQNLVSS
nr:MAG TPA: hypothetical protein [Caudoviricetes sp.]